jgi:hypothetical protein
MYYSTDPLFLSLRDLSLEQQLNAVSRIIIILGSADASLLLKTLVTDRLSAAI